MATPIWPMTAEEIKQLVEMGQEELRRLRLSELYRGQVDRQPFHTQTWPSRTASQRSTPSSDTPQTKDG
jgi:hypothetical protein